MKVRSRIDLLKGALGVTVLGVATVGVITLGGHQPASKGQHKSTDTIIHKVLPPKPASSQAPLPGTLPMTFPPVPNVGTGNQAVPVGNYVEHEPGDSGPNNGPPWSGAHYVLQVTSSSGQHFSGEVYDIYTDGRNDKVLPFEGVLSTSNNSATLTVTGPPQMRYSFPEAAVNQGTTIQAPIANRTITLDGCQNYLHWLSPAGGAPANLYATHPYECTFAYMGSSEVYN